MQAKDIPEKPILQFLSTLGRWGTWFNGFDNSVQNAMPPDVPSKVALAKMKQLKKRGLISGCTCGCRGDFELTDKGRALLKAIPVDLGTIPAGYGSGCDVAHIRFNGGE